MVKPCGSAVLLATQAGGATLVDVLRAVIACARVALPALLAFAVMTAAERLAGTSPIRSQVQPTSVLWAGRIFATREDLTRWLRARGASYETWALKHLPPAAQASPTQAQAAHVRAGVVQSKSLDATHLMAVVVGGCVAFVLALILLYQRRTYDFRGRLQRSRPALAWSGGHDRTIPDVRARRVVARDAAISVRARVVHPAASAVKAVAYKAGPAFLTVARPGARRREWARNFRQQHPEVAWYVGACAFAVAVGFVVPYVIR